MKSRNAVAKAASTSSVLSQPDTPGEGAAKHARTPEEIRQRAFEIHCERGECNVTACIQDYRGKYGVDGEVPCRSNVVVSKNVSAAYRPIVVSARKRSIGSNIVIGVIRDGKDCCVKDAS